MGVRGRVLLILAALMAPFALASSAAAQPPPSPPFTACPEFNPPVEECIFAEESGSLSIGKSSVTIASPIDLQGGLTAPTFYWANPAADTLPPTVPLTIAGPPPALGLTATIELATPPVAPSAPQPPPVVDSAIELNPDNELSEEGVALRLPVQIKVGSKNAGVNALLGGKCYVTPITLELTTGTTSPPAPNKAIKGRAGEVEVQYGGDLLILNNDSLVDNSFAVPKATGCGPGGAVIDALVTGWVNGLLELPAAAGSNTVILDGKLEAYAL